MDEQKEDRQEDRHEECEVVLGSEQQYEERLQDLTGKFNDLSVPELGFVVFTQKTLPIDFRVRL